MERKYIIKFNAPHVIGYQVRIPYFKDGLPSYKLGHISKFFRKITTWKAALAEARIYRDDFLKSNNMNLYSKRIRKTSHDNYQGNTSGVIGVSETFCLKKNGYYYVGYTAYYNIDEKQHKKTFAVIKYGEREAFKLACRIRQKHSGALIIVDRIALPCLPDVEYIIRGKQ